MNQAEQSTEVQSPAQRAEILAALACVVSLFYLFSVGEPAVEWLGTRWAGWLVYALLPMALTFAILNCSCVHREMRKAVRSLFLTLISVLIYGGACLAGAIIIFLAAILLPVSRFHY